MTHNGTALICRPGSEDRDQDCINVRGVLKRELGLTVAELGSATARLSGSDVLFTGTEFFVGLGARSNTEGALAVAATWPEYPCTPVKVGTHFEQFNPPTFIFGQSLAFLLEAPFILFLS